MFLPEYKESSFKIDSIRREIPEITKLWTIKKTRE